LGVITAVIFEALGDAVYFLLLLVTGVSEKCYAGIFGIKV